MIGKNNTTSQLDFFLLEEISDEAAEVISGGQELVLGGIQEIAIDLAEVPLLPITLPIDIMSGLLGALESGAGLLGSVPNPAGLAGGFPNPTTLLPLGVGLPVGGVVEEV
ncbi:hypothetical protein IQ238_16595 [Pleurocapsales cyanobacterium LEGE 06147]|nr:hypothetical protein [Pleurocapsales cyanobacterium LEGE 06147]